jgi:hypothetical protein
MKKGNDKKEAAGYKNASNTFQMVSVVNFLLNKTFKDENKGNVSGMNLS